MSEFQTLARYESLMVFIVLLLVGFMAYVSYKKGGMPTLSGFDNYSSMRLNNAGIPESSLGSMEKDPREGFGGYEPPVFWVAGNMKAITDSQQAAAAEPVDGSAMLPTPAVTSDMSAADMPASASPAAAMSAAAAPAAVKSGFRGRMVPYDGLREGLVNNQVLNPY